jgi:hypothetical protein
MPKRLSDSGLTLTLFIFFMAYALVATLFAEHRLWTSVVFGILFAILVFALIKFPMFRHNTWMGTKRIFSIVANWLTQSGRARKPPRTRIPAKVRREVCRRANYACQMCGRLETPKYHHIDGDPSNPNLNNLILLCSHHHDLADRNVYPSVQLKGLSKKPFRRRLAY